ncbi:hypothetical protein LWP59_34235 [Amycolatopsis acidiphila]|uniref:Uncharacterized protein n=1 Tax=Amycolatopsis acidiphila TaxID=715473 RepID=A0A558A0A5_9PSEU|nr:hypothetical protein [Amycolatopsis acidiphila]TVT17700.1 hypothetical protein FNH06_30550 [Amycolatopsis acidiphila]UIJ59070.1 hypothetical protein LWP59_34235 [Amycolatopsis acidiphila]
MLDRQVRLRAVEAEPLTDVEVGELLPVLPEATALISTTTRAPLSSILGSFTREKQARSKVSVSAVNSWTSVARSGPVIAEQERDVLELVPSVPFFADETEGMRALGELFEVRAQTPKNSGTASEQRGTADLHNGRHNASGRTSALVLLHPPCWRRQKR